MQENNQIVNPVETQVNTQISQNSITQSAIENNEVNEIKIPEKELPRRAIKLEDGTIIEGLKITYKNLFDFENSYPHAKDLMEALVKKQTFDHEAMVQLIYVGYLGTNPVKKMDYIEFIESVPFSYKRDMELFKDLTGLTADQNEKN